MNSLDALVTAAKEGAGIVRAASWLAETDLITDHPVRHRPVWRTARVVR